jgi:uncharacterized membrane protein YgdD (TMEM256/DUF423 family)
LKGRLADVPDVARRLGWWDTASHYHLLHALALGVFGLAVDRLARAWLGWAGGAMVVGIVLFSGSLYLMAVTGVTALGAVTPIGGLGLCAGWFAFGMGVLRRAPAG